MPPSTPTTPTPIAKHCDNASTDAEARLTRHLAAIEAGVDPQALVTAMNTAQADKAAARAELQNLPKIDRLTETEIRKLIESVGDIRAVLTAGNPSDKIQQYAALDLQVRYQHQQQLAIVGVTPCGISAGVRRGYRPVRQPPATSNTAGHREIAVA
ncbi:hypothetical protein [Nocardia vinacea]|uniref:hypothetical protein n=1 Tax=Nocardia vinacea TaxID=96468 RepID=UPI0012F6C52C|nr:hypothetical protein [Nocardia vinacea]